MYALLLASASEEPPVWAIVFGIIWACLFVIAILAVTILAIVKYPQWKAEQEAKKAEGEGNLLLKNTEYLRNFFEKFRDDQRDKYLKSDEACIAFLKHYQKVRAEFDVPMASEYQNISRSGDYFAICNKKPAIIFSYAAVVLEAETDCTFEDFLNKIPEIAQGHMELTRDKANEQWRNLEDEADEGKSSFYIIAPVSELLYYEVNMIQKTSYSQAPSGLSLAFTEAMWGSGAAVAKANQSNLSYTAKQVELYFDINSTIPSPLKCTGKHAEHLQAIFPDKRR